MKLLLSLIIPLIIIALPIVPQVYLNKKAYKKADVSLVIIIGLGALILGVFTPILATYVSIKGFMWDTKEPGCVTGVVTFTFFGALASLATIPITISYWVETKRRKKWLMAEANKLVRPNE